MDQRTYGIEIEFLSKVDGSTIVNELTSRFQLANTNFTAQQGWAQYDFTQWLLGHDGSISGAFGPYRFMYELKSPKLKGKEGLAALKIVTDYLNEVGKVNNSCGLHVHHGIESREQAEKIGKVWIKVEDLVFNCLPNIRKSNGYCQRWNQSYSRTDESKIERAFAERRMALNLKAFRQHGTVEFRCLEGTLDYTVISNWVLISKGIINIALHKEEQPKVETVQAFRNILYSVVAETVEETSSIENNSVERLSGTDYEVIRSLKHSPRSTIVAVLDRLIEMGEYNFDQLVAKVQDQVPSKSPVTIRTYIKRSVNPKYNRLRTKVIIQDGIYKFENHPEMPVIQNEDDLILVTVTKKKVDKAYQIACLWLENRFSVYAERQTPEVSAPVPPVQTETDPLQILFNIDNIPFEDARLSSL